MTAKTTIYPLRLPVSIRSEAEKLAAAEKVAVLRTASYFADRRGRADWEAFDRLMQRNGGEPPRFGDELPED